MKYIQYIYCAIFMTMSCYCANGPDQKSEISPRDQESPRKKFFSGKVDLRKAIANSSPRRTTSRDEIERFEGLPREGSPRDLESPRTRLKKSQSANFSPQRDNKTLRDVISLEEGSSPRGEGIVLALLRQTREEKKVKIFREKSSVPQVIDFQHSSPDPKLLILMGESEKLSSNNKHEKMPLLDDLFPKGESSSSKSEIGSESK